MPRKFSHRVLGLVLAVAAAATLLGPVVASAGQSDDRISDTEFWRLISELSEDSGTFARQLMSNEDSAQFVMPALGTLTQPGGVYIGVGAEQNFTYLAAIRPRIAFIVDIRRDNLLQVLMYKALFELSGDRAELVSRLFSRSRPAGLGAESTVAEIFDAFEAESADAALLEQNVRAITANLVGTHAFPLSTADTAAIAAMMDTFRTAGPSGLRGYGDRSQPTFDELMAVSDVAGEQHGFLASEAAFAYVRGLQQANLIVPVVGDFAGDRALAGIGRYLREREAEVTVFYVSNVERYLFEQGEHGRAFYANVEALPTAATGLFIRSVTTDISLRLGIPIPEGPARWRTFLFSIAESVEGVTSGRVTSYRELFDVGRR